MNVSTVLHKSVNKVFIAWTFVSIELLFLSFMFSGTPQSKAVLEGPWTCSDVKSLALALALRLKSLLTTLGLTIRLYPVPIDS